MAETMQHVTSPQLKHVQATNVVDSFTDGLVGPLSNDSNVSQVDTFIEEPFCILNLRSQTLDLYSTTPRRQTQRPGDLVNLFQGCGGFFVQYAREAETKSRCKFT